MTQQQNLYVRYTDKTGRGYKSFGPIINYQESDTGETDYNGEEFTEWITDDREDGDIFENAASRYEIVSHS